MDSRYDFAAPGTPVSGFVHPFTQIKPIDHFINIFPVLGNELYCPGSIPCLCKGLMLFEAHTGYANTPRHYRLLVVFNPQQEELKMTKPTPRIKRVLFFSACALTLGAISGVTHAHVCMKKSYGHSYMTPMHPHGMQRYYGPIKAYGHPPNSYRTPAYQEPLTKHTYATRRQQDTASSSNTATAHAHEPDIIETATAAGDFNALIKAAVAADLYDTLRGEGPFTLFAPTDAAFAKLPDGMLDELLADKDMLAAILSYHIVAGRLTAADLLQQREFKTVQGQALSINDLDVISADHETANGIVHVIENVVVPRL